MERDHRSFCALNHVWSPNTTWRRMARRLADAKKIALCILWNPPSSAKDSGT